MKTLITRTLCLVVALSATTAEARTYTLREAVSDAVLRSDAVAAAEAKTDGLQAEADKALAALFPGVALSGGWVHMDTAPYVEVEFDPTTLFPESVLDMLQGIPGVSLDDFQPNTMQLEMGRQDMVQFQLQGEQILFAGTGLHRQRAMAAAQLRSAREEERVTRHEVSYRTEEMFWTLALARQALDVTSQAIETAETHVGLLENFVEVGLASQSDLMAARVQLASLKLTQLQARQGAELAENAFCMLVHVPDSETVDLDTSGGGLPLALPADPVALDDLAVQSRPELRVLEQQQLSTRHAAGAAWASWLPAFALYGNVYLKNPDRANEPSFYWSADFMLGMQWKLWDRGAALHNNRRAHAGLAQIDATRRQLVDGIELQIDQALAARREANEQVQVAGEVVELAEESLRLVQLNFSEGMARNVDVLEAQTALSKAKLDALDAETKLRIAEAGLRRAVGVDVE